MKSIGFATGILIGVILAIILCIFANKNHKAKTQYDERQKEVRGKGYQYGFYTIVIFEILMMIFDLSEIQFPFDHYILHFAGVVLGGLVLSGYCIWNDAYWGLNNNRKRFGLMFLVLAVLNAIPVVGSLINGSFSTAPFINLMVLIMMLILGTELLVKNTLEKRDSE
jgi:hypothetical protein